MEKNLLLLFDRPCEPIYVPKGEQRINFDIPTNYMPDKYKNVAQTILRRYNKESQSSVTIKEIPIPDLSLPLSLNRQAGFTLFIPEHRKMAGRLIDLFMGMRSIDDLMSLGAYCHERTNSQLFIYALSVAILHRPDTKKLQIPQLVECFPDRFMDSAVFNRAIEEANIVPNGSRTPVEIPLAYTATDADPEHRVAYWREDLGINLHHWHWHLVYPFDGPLSTVKKDRRGELVYYMHHQIMCRYNTERICNNLPRVRRLVNLRDPIPEAYFPKLDQVVAGRAWPSRPANFNLSDVDRKADKVRFDLGDLERYRDRIMEAIHTRSVRTTQGTTIPLDEATGIDILGNLMESSILSPNRVYYGDLHNFGHLAIAYCHDPDHRYLEPIGVMGDPTTAMRDPIFYRWHAYVDDIFAVYKDSLPPYTNKQLLFPGVRVTNIHINTPGANPNTLNCFWTTSYIDLSRGLDFTPRGAISAKVQHLNHDDFSYTITANNSNNQDVTGTVRIFMAPKFDENGRRLNFNDQRLLMIEMDKFTTRLRRGENTITRNSVDSSVTIPFEATFRNVDENRPSDSQIADFDAFNFCGCGWPQHMLVPKGTRQGFPMDLFVMISNYEFDKVDQPDATGCSDGVSFCGLRGLKYPDARPMGFPFDRTGTSIINFMSDFVNPNMMLQQITIRFSDVIKPRQTNTGRSNGMIPRSAFVTKSDS